MLIDRTYRKWTEVFHTGSHFVGGWNQGSRILFLAPNDRGGMEGMVSRIKESRLHEFISIEHLGVVNNGMEDTTSEAAKRWAGVHENYTFKETRGATELIVDMDSTNEYRKYFEETWPPALQKLKEIAEAATSRTITVGATIAAPMEKVWEFWTKPDHIVKWCYASDDWEAPHAENDVRAAGKFKTVMAAKDKSISFDFTGVYTRVKEYEHIEYNTDDGRHVKVEFEELSADAKALAGKPEGEGVKITETFEAEKINPVEMQRSGWQAILDNFKKYTESFNT